MSSIKEQADFITRIWQWIPPPFSPPTSPLPPPSPAGETFLVRLDPRVVNGDPNDFGKSRWPASPTPSDANSQVFWTRGPLCYLSQDDLAEVVGTVLISRTPRTISSELASLEIVKGLLKNLFDYGGPLRTFAHAGDLLARLPRTEAFAEEWRQMGPENEPIDQYDINDPEGLDIPSITGSRHRVPSYFPAGPPRTPRYATELLIMAALAAASRAVGSPRRPFADPQYWSLGVSGGRWNGPQFLAAMRAFNAWLRTNPLEVDGQGACAMMGEMRLVGEMAGKVVTWI
ncbi:hypothetical protein MMC07_001691 [Pseudocyphellaria aurata]|nr:hypothetical protein [Pseudocyphellaria aurata]